MGMKPREREREMTNIYIHKMEREENNHLSDN
jgi:hypothetical protein